MSASGTTVVVMPAFNEAATVADVAARARARIPRVIVVDDGSVDGTAERLDGLGVTVVRHERNLGKGASLARGFRLALEQGADVVITLDADGQHRPEDIPRLLAAAAHHPGRIVIGARTRGRDAAPRLRLFANRQADFWISWAAGYPIRDTQSGFRLYPARLIRDLGPSLGRRARFVFESEVLIEAARRGVLACSVDIDAIYTWGPRASHYRALADTWQIVAMVACKLASRGFNPRGLLCALGLLAPRGDEARRGHDDWSRGLK